MTCPGCSREIKFVAVMGMCRLPGCASCGLTEYFLCESCADIVRNGNDEARKQLALRVELNLSDGVGGVQ